MQLEISHETHNINIHFLHPGRSDSFSGVRVEKGCCQVTWFNVLPLNSNLRGISRILLSASKAKCGKLLKLVFHLQTTEPEKSFVAHTLNLEEVSFNTLAFYALIFDEIQVKLRHLSNF